MFNKYKKMWQEQNKEIDKLQEKNNKDVKKFQKEKENLENVILKLQEENLKVRDDYKFLQKEFNNLFDNFEELSENYEVEKSKRITYAKKNGGLKRAFNVLEQKYKEEKEIKEKLLNYIKNKEFKTKKLKNVSLENLILYQMNGKINGGKRVG